MDNKQKLTRKQQAFVDYFIKYPKASATEAAMFAYNTDNPVVAASIGYENLRKPQIMAYMQTVSELLEETIVQVVRDWGRSENPRKREIAVRTAMWSHDKIHGRATTKLDIPTSIVKVAINLTGDDELAPSDLTEVAPITSR